MISCQINIIKLGALFSLVFLTFLACKKEKVVKEEEEPFDKSGMLTNYADNVILPNYINFNSKLDSLITSFNTFTVNYSTPNFQIVKQKFNNVYSAYQQISLFEIGPAEQVIVRMNFNVFPTDTVQIKNNISSGIYNLETASNLDAKGLPALDYIFYGNNSSEVAIVQSFSTTSNKVKYVADVLTEMKTKITYVINNWNISYKSSFTSNLGVDIGSPIGLLVNQLNFELDYLKNSKIGIPLGKKSLGVMLPEKCESFYNPSKSVSYIKNTLQVIESVYLGKSTNGNNGLGFDDYLEHLKINHTNGTLNDAIKNQFAVCFSKINALETAGDFKIQITANTANVEQLYNELIKLLVLLKTDMPSNLGVVITYQDGDGD